MKLEESYGPQVNLNLMINVYGCRQNFETNKIYRLLSPFNAITHKTRKEDMSNFEILVLGILFCFS
jgi:hypothetical protein